VSESLTGHIPNTSKTLYSLELTCITGLEVPRTGHFTFIVHEFNGEDSYVMGDKKNVLVLLLKTPNSLKFQALLIYVHSKGTSRLKSCDWGHMSRRRPAATVLLKYCLSFMATVNLSFRLTYILYHMQT
jgi:hypothetical protein